MDVQLQFEFLNEWQQIDAFVQALRGGFDIDHEIERARSFADREELLNYPPAPTCQEGV